MVPAQVMLCGMWKCYVVSFAPCPQFDVAESPAVDSRKYRLSQIDVFVLLCCPGRLDGSFFAVSFQLLCSQWPVIFLLPTSRWGLVVSEWDSSMAFIFM